MIWISPYYLVLLCMRKYLILILLLLLGQSLWAQSDSLRLGYSVQGTVVDAASGKALESAHITIPGRNQATVTNQDGFFILKSNSPIEEIECSLLGYKTNRLQTQERMRIPLYKESLTLEAASIITGNPEEIVRAAADNIWTTYCTHPELLECFYRETLQKRNRFTYVSEAVARLYKGRYSGSNIAQDAAALEKSRILVSQRKRDTLSIKTQGGPTMAIHVDLVKNSGVLFTRQEMSLYHYEMLTPQYIGDRLQFVIQMTPDAEVDYALYNCVLYIDREYLTFTRIEASLDMSDQGKATQLMLVRKPVTLRFYPDESSVVINYRLEGRHTRLEYIRTTMRFRCDWRKRLLKTSYTAINELVVTDVRPEAVPIPRQERFRSTDSMSDKALLFLDKDFWADYNIIEPSESLEHAMGRLRRDRGKN